MEATPFAIIQAAGRQYRVEPDQVFEVEGLRLKALAKEVVFDKVLAVQKGESLEPGSPFVKGATVTCEVLDEIRGAKKVIFKIRRRKNYRRKKGYRAALSRLRVKEIHF